MSVVKCEFCGKLFEGIKPIDNACPSCVQEAKRNSQPYPPDKKEKKFVESDGFFDEKEYLQEEKSSGFFESTEYNLPKK